MRMAVWVMLPAGEITENMISQLATHLEDGRIWRAVGVGGVAIGKWPVLAAFIKLACPRIKAEA